MRSRQRVLIFMGQIDQREKTLVFCADQDILTTSQKLSTEVDARNIRSIVLVRPIRSTIEFKQIAGRGTRLYDGKDFGTRPSSPSCWPITSASGSGSWTRRS